MQLQGKTAMVTGSSRGIGRAIALALAKEGTDVAVHCRRERTQGEQVVAQIRALGQRAVLHAATRSPLAARTIVISFTPRHCGTNSSGLQVCPKSVLVRMQPQSGSNFLGKKAAGWKAVLMIRSTSPLSGSRVNEGRIPFAFGVAISRG